MMRTPALPALVLVLTFGMWQAAGSATQDPLAPGEPAPEPAPAVSLDAFTRMLPGNGLELALVHLNPHTVPIFFEPPTLYAIRAHASESTLLYVQGTAERNVQLDTTTFVIDQGGESMTGRPINIRHFESGTVTVPEGERVDGMLAFERPVDVTAPFTVRHGDDSVEFSLSAAAVALLAMPPPP